MYNLCNALIGSKEATHSLHTSVKLTDFYLRNPVVDNTYQLIIRDLAGNGVGTTEAVMLNCFNSKFSLVMTQSSPLVYYAMSQQV